MDEDLDSLSHAKLIIEAKKMRAAIRAHRDATSQDLCWHHPKLWELLSDKAGPSLSVPEWPQFLRGCINYRQSLDTQLPKAPRTEDEYGD